jgi:superfamily II DNA/RNA helicase
VTHEVDSAASPVPAMDHHVFNVDAADRGEVVAQLVGGQGRTLAFARTKHQAKRWARTLTASGIHAVDLHGNLSQAARQRNLAAFADGDVRVLVATDIAARGIHVDDITLVVHIDPPAEHKAYLHRSGRTARAGAAGVVVTVATHDQRRDVADLMRRAAITPTQHKVRAGDSAIADIAGPSAPRVVVPNAQPIPEERTGRGSGRGSGGGRGRTSGGSSSGSSAAGSSGGRQRSTSGSRSGQGSSSSPSRSSQSRSSAPRSSQSTSSAARASGGSTTVWSSNGGATAPSTPRRGPRRATRPAGGAGSAA